ncbi:MAG TPA: hypothetical protein VMZ66_13430 [Aeromicrobium sp.]|nr:hypothetical protein [Aeromicrobium sp.]
MFGRRKRHDSDGGPSQGAAMRAMVLALTPHEIGVAPHAGRHVWGIVMDTAMADGNWHSLVVLADGTTSLYTSAAFGIIGAGTHESVRLASDRLLELAEQELGLFAPDSNDAVPASGMVALRALTFEGRRVVVAPEDDLGHGRHVASPVFHAVHEVITQTRLVTPT